jgi:hypothetical protein
MVGRLAEDAEVKVDLVDGHGRIMIRE